ncbi:hypothetical protein [Neptunicella marina]|uniref:Uncharacterized protein n=1 Tax=Neptunicella marina TaxID=2125989 RepID=A0A8J6M0K5_9ALTE|nr:hypothetical protein [Neptunicella marina]MBC3767465.1 hypothetical protein [Neptunicella marina]
MHCDLPAIKELCDELGINTSIHDGKLVKVMLENDVFLCFENIEEGDCLIGFEGTPWHFHGDIQFCDGRGYYLDVNYLDVITEITKGKILVCELWENEKLEDRYLIHNEYNDEFKYMQPNEKIVVKSYAK